MSTLATKRILLGLSVLVLVATAIAITSLVRGEATRETQNTFIQQSPCTLDPASKECQTTKRQSDRERTVKDSCIPFKKVLTEEAYFQITRCPRKGVVNLNSPSASQPSGPSGGGNDETNPPPAESPDVGLVPTEPVTPSKPSEPVTPSEPTAPAPQPVAPAPANPLIDLTPVTDPVCSIAASLAKIC